jgi:hypothetical protein
MSLHLMKLLTGEEKKTLIQELVTIGAPLLGALKPLFYMTGSRSFLYYSQVVDWTHWKWLGHFFDGINSKFSAEMLPSLDLMFDMIQFPDSLSAHFNDFKENYQFLIEQKAVSEGLLSSVYQDSEHTLQGNLIEKQYGEMTSFDGECVNETLTLSVQHLKFKRNTREIRCSRQNKRILEGLPLCRIGRE